MGSDCLMGLGFPCEGDEDALELKRGDGWLHYSTYAMPLFVF